jgi:hypothetical protein
VWLFLDYAGVYCGLIELGSHALYGVEEDVTYAIVERIPQKPEMVRLPRYQKFTAAACRLLASGARFDEVAGNRQTMLTAWFRAIGNSRLAKAKCCSRPLS